MKTYTINTTPEEVIEQQLPSKYQMKLNKSDMMNLLEVLRITSENATREDMCEWATEMRVDILSTINIEEV